MFPRERHKIIDLRHDELKKLDLPPPGQGLIYAEGFTYNSWHEREFFPAFVLAPRSTSFEQTHLNNPKRCCALLKAIESCLEVSTKRAGKVQKRGKGRPIFYDDPSLSATTLGPKARRFGRGVTDDSFHFEIMEAADLESFSKIVNQLDTVSNIVLPHHIVTDMLECVESLNVKSFGDSNSKYSLSAVLQCSRRGTFAHWKMRLWHTFAFQG